MRKRGILIALLPAVLVVALAGVFRWLLFSESGANFVWRQVVAAVPGELSAERIEGALKTRLRVSGLAYRDGDLRVLLDRGELRLDLALWPLALSFDAVELGQLDIELPPETGEAGDPAASLEALALPFPVSFDRLEARRVRLAEAGASSEPLAELEGIYAEVEWFHRLQLRRLQVDVPGPGMRLEGRAALRLARPFALELDARAITRAGAFGAEAPLTLEARASGDLGSLRVEAALDQPAATLEGSLEDLLNTPRADLALSVPQWSVAGESGSEWRFDEIALSVYGLAADFGLEGSTLLTGPGLPPTRLRLSGTGDGAGLELEHLALDGETVVLAGSGRLLWDPEPHIAARLEVERLDPRPWWAEWGDAEPLAGRLEVEWLGERLSVRGLEVAAPGAFARLAGAGAVDFAGGSLEADFVWRDLAWPPGASTPTLRSESGKGLLEGSLDDWRFDGEARVVGADFPAGEVRLQARGDREKLDFEAPAGEVLGGRFAARGSFRWAPQLAWDVDAAVESLQTGPLFADFPGRLNGRLRAAGVAAEDRVDLRLDDVAGTVRGRAVSANGALSWRAGRLEADRLLIRSGASEVTLHGSPRSTEGLQAQARIASLADLLDGAAGSLHGEAWLRWDGAEPGLRLDLAGESLVWGEFSLGRIIAQTPQPGELAIELAGLAWPEGQVDGLSLESSGSRLLERVEIEARLPGGDIAARLEEGRMDWSQPVATGWQGQLASLRLSSEDPPGSLALEQPTALQVSGERLVLQQACLRGPEDGRLCLESVMQLEGERTVQASLERISPNTLLSFAGSGLVLTHRLSGTAGWRQLPGVPPAARVDLAVSPGQIVIDGEEQALLETGAGHFGFAIEDGRLHGGELLLPLAEGGGVEMSFEAPDLSGGMESAVGGRLRIELRDIAPLLELTAFLEGESGPVTADLRFSGTLGDPRFTGHMSLVRGRILHFPTGLLLEDLRLAGAVYEFDQTELHGSFRIGEGQGTIRAVMNFHDMLSPEFQVELAGDRLRLIDVPDLRVEAAPGLRLTWGDDLLQVDGRISVPSARLSPRYLPTAGASESPDATIVAGVDPLAVEAAPQPRAWQVRGKLALELGDDVVVVLDRASASVGGKATFTWAGEPVPRASGGFTLSGEINAYGQLLRIEEGRVSFSKRPVDDPFLNIRAEREIYGNSQIRSAGVLVTGSVKRPVLEPYSVPMTTRERALALLVTGSDFDYEQGVGAVQVGMYVAPKLYVSYGVGLFDDQNVISARYDLGKGFSLKTTSGQRETGVDIDYTVER